MATGYSSLPRFGIRGCESLAKDYLTRVGYDECVPAKLQSFSACETGAYPSLVADWACGCMPRAFDSDIANQSQEAFQGSSKTHARVSGLLWALDSGSASVTSQAALRKVSAAVPGR